MNVYVIKKILHTCIRVIQPLIPRLQSKLALWHPQPATHVRCRASVSLFILPVHYNMFIHTLISMYLEIYSVLAEFQNIFKIHRWECSTYTKKKNFTFVYKQQKECYRYKIDQKVFRWASNYMLTLETDEGCPAFLPLLPYLHG